jgi:hypothetical protein
MLECSQMTHFFEKLNGIPAIAIGILVLAGVAYGAYYTYNNLEVERAVILTHLFSAGGRSRGSLTPFRAR